MASNCPDTAEIYFTCCGREIGGTVQADAPFRFTCMGCNNTHHGQAPKANRKRWVRMGSPFETWTVIYQQQLTDSHDYQWHYETEDPPDEQAFHWFEQDFGIRIGRTERIIQDEREHHAAANP